VIKISELVEADLRARILAAWQTAGSLDFEEGRPWYQVAHQIAGIVGDGDIVKGSGILAALSSNTEWGQNVKLAYQCGNGDIRGHFAQVLDKVTAIYNGTPALSVLPEGRKTWHFAHCIIDPTDNYHVAIDRWSFEVAAGYRKKSLTPLQYETVANAYRAVAADLGELPLTVQAVTWVSIRRIQGVK
jgi:hypothetical protein